MASKPAFLARKATFRNYLSLPVYFTGSWYGHKTFGSGKKEMAEADMGGVPSAPGMEFLPVPGLI